MSDMEIPSHKYPEGDMVLSELLAEEVRTGRDVSDSDDMQVTTADGLHAHAESAGELHSDELPSRIAELLIPSTFAEPVFEEVDWLIADGALLSVTTRARMLAAVDRALRLRRADDRLFKAPDEPFADVPDEFGHLATELRHLLNAVANGQVRPREFSPVRVNDLVQAAAIDPVVAFAAFRKSIRAAQGIRSDQVAVLGSHYFDDWENELRHLRRLLLLGHVPRPIDDVSDGRGADSV